MIASIGGYAQHKLIEYGVDHKSIGLLDCLSSLSAMSSINHLDKEIDNETYFSLEYKFIIKYFPILDIGENKLYQEISKLEKTGMIKCAIVDEVPYYRGTDKQFLLQYDKLPDWC
jgi:hypothetical protein